MNIYCLKYTSVLLIFLCLIKEIRTQTFFQTYVDVGKTNSSVGVYIKNAYRMSYLKNKNKFGAGAQVDFSNNRSKTVSAFDFSASSDILIKKMPLEIKGIFILSKVSNLLYETNWGLRVETRKFDHFSLEVGSNFKTYIITAEGRNTYNINKQNSKLSENFNLTYTLNTSLKPDSSTWNIGLSCTNVDYYLINQSTNPIFNLQATYKLNPNLTFNLEGWYKQAGIFNISANYFGYFFRGGIKWKI